MKKELVALSVIAIAGLCMALIGFAVRYSLIDLSQAPLQYGYRAEGMICGLFGFVLFAYAAIRLAQKSSKP